MEFTSSKNRQTIPPRFIDPRTVAFIKPSSRGELPHLYKRGSTYFVTFRLFDALGPKSDSAVIDWETAQAEVIAGINDPPLTLGACALGIPEVASMVQSALVFFHGERYWMREWCVMPNHVHALVTPLDGHHMSDILHSWKSFTSNQANRLLNRSGTFWERESFDHACRSVEYLERFARYIRENPVAAGLCARAFDWKWGSAYVRSLKEVADKRMKFWWETEGHGGAGFQPAT